jgi:hypothetical protein
VFLTARQKGRSAFYTLHSTTILVSERCRYEPWSIDLERHNKELALRCIKLLDKELRENICDMTLPYLSRKRTLPEAISYACKFWIDHICLDFEHVTDDIVKSNSSNFLDKHLLHWIEGSAILKSHDRTIRSIRQSHEVAPGLSSNMCNGSFPLNMLIQKSSRSDTSLHQLLYDGHRFAQYFANTIMTHPLLLYTTALSFTPTNTSILRSFITVACRKLVCGVDKMWPPELHAAPRP